MMIVRSMLLGILIALPAYAAEICAHRGDVAAAPENTIAAIESAVTKGVGMIEYDVQLSKDGQLVLMHDATVNRTTNAKGMVGTFTFAELRKLDAGSWYSEDFAGASIPTLEETLNLIPKGVLSNVHLKNSPGVAEAAARELKRLGRLEDSFLACSIEQAAEARAAVPEVMICNMSRQGGDRTGYVDLTIDEKCEFIQLHKRNGLENIQAHVRRLHDAGVRVNFFGTEDPEMIRKLRDAGVDFILTDDVDTARAALGKNGE